MTTPDVQVTKERRVSLTVTIRVDDIEQMAAIELQNAIADLVEDVGGEAIANQGAPRLLNTPR